MCYCPRRDIRIQGIIALLSQEGYKDTRYYCVIVTGGVGVVIVSLSLEGYEMLLLCYCQRRDRCYYCVIVTRGMGVITVLMSQEGWEVLLLCYCHRRDMCYYCVIVTGGI